MAGRWRRRSSSPASREEAVEAFGDGAGVTVVAGGTIVMPEITHGRLRPARALLIGRAGLGGRPARRRPHDDRRGRRRSPSSRTRAEPLGACARARRRPRDPRPGHASAATCARRRATRARAATCRPRCSRSTRRCARPGAGGERTEPVEDFLADGRRRAARARRLLRRPAGRGDRERCAGPTPTPTRSCASAPPAPAASCASPSRAPGPVAVRSRAVEGRRRRRRRRGRASACSTTSPRTTTRSRRPGTAAGCCRCSSAAPSTDLR